MTVGKKAMLYYQTVFQGRKGKKKSEEIFAQFSDWRQTDRLDGVQYVGGVGRDYWTHTSGLFFFPEKKYKRKEMEKEMLKPAGQEGPLLVFFFPFGVTPLARKEGKERREKRGGSAGRLNIEKGEFFPLSPPSSFLQGLKLA